MQCYNNKQTADFGHGGVKEIYDKARAESFANHGSELFVSYAVCSFLTLVSV